MCASEGVSGMIDFFFFSFWGDKRVHVIVHTIPRPPALLTALASSAYPTLGAFEIRHVAQASSEESSCGVTIAFHLGPRELR